MTTWTENTDAFGVRQVYKTEENGTIWLVPVDESNSDYQRYLRHLAGEDESGTLTNQGGLN